MRRIILFLLCCALLCGTVLAAGQVTGLQSHSTVGSDGSCQVTMTVNIHVDAGAESLTFPLPGNASGVTLNGSSVRTQKSGDLRTVSLDKLYGGGAWDGTLTFHYTVSDTVTMGEDGKLVLELPILCGFAFPVEQMEFTVTLPGQITAVPTFFSGYHQESIEASMSYTVNGSQLSGVMLERLLDRETLTMTLQVTEEMFPGITAADPESPVFPVAMGICAALALCYWLLFLRCAPVRRLHRTTPPEGLSAGELCSRLVGTGADLSLMVVSWAELGYLYMDRDDTGRIFLRKRMEMGNERSAFENHCFRSLFGNKRSVDGTGYHYARLCRKVAEEGANRKGQYLPSSGNPTLFRGLCCGIGAFSGGAMGMALASTSAWRIVLAVLLGILCAAASWFIQGGCRCLHLRHRAPAFLGLGCCGVWLVLAALAGTWSTAIPAILAQILGGLAAFYGGRRTDAARQTAGEILGLRHYLKTVSRRELQRILASNPDYYYELAPYALALGVDRAFARRFGRLRQPGCTYLVTGIGAPTAARWYPQLREAVDTLDARQKRMRYERFFKI